MENNTRWQEFNSIIDNEILHPKEKLLLLTIFRYYNQEKRYSYPPKELLKAKCSITHDRDYYKYINKLEINNYIVKETIKGIGCKFYLTNCQKGSCLQNDSNCQNGSNTYCQNDSQPTTKKVVQKENKRKVKENIYMDLTFIDDVIDSVKITQDKYDKLVNKFGTELINNQVIALDNYIANGKGTTYKDHYRVLNTWCSDKQLENVKGQANVNDNGIREF